MTLADAEKPPAIRLARDTRQVMLLFAAMYFVQGIAEPTEGLIAQPVRSLLKDWGYATVDRSHFAALLALPWTLKPLFGLLTDFVPLAGTRRRSYLLLTSALTVISLAALYWHPFTAPAYWPLLIVLIVPTACVAFSDVVVDALMVEIGQPRGLTGRLQSVQWGSMYAASMLAAYVGGWLSHYRLQKLGFLICALATFVTLLLAWAFVHEPRKASTAGGREQLGQAARELRAATLRPAVLLASAFLFLWNFNPFNTSVLYEYMTVHLGLSEPFYGTSVMVMSGGAVAGSLAYGLYCRRIPLTWLLYLSIVAGVLATLAYWALLGQRSAVVISALVGFSYMTGTMVQFDLAARACPIAAAGTTFALLMAISNLGVSASIGLGGMLYETWSGLWGPTMAFNLLVGIGAATTLACCPLVRPIERSLTKKGTS